MARGVAPSVFSFDINPTQLSQAVPQAPEFFRRQQQIQDGYVRRPSFWGIYSKPVPSASLSRCLVGPALSGDFRLGLYFSLQHDVWSRTMKALFVLLCPTGAGNASDYRWVNG